jgi:structural maintenance of chromosome 3 (chondroitin sulfate proteoglycan 6)
VIFQLLKRLHKVKTSLTKYAHVNKQAIQMYEQNDKLRNDIFGRHKEMERSSESIQRLIESLDKQKEEVIERIFTQVSGFFSEIFEKLVPAGRGRLIMIKKSAAQVSQQE